MKDFVFYSPTKVVFGENAQQNVAECIREFSGTRVLLHFGGKSAEKSGLLGEVETLLKKACIEFVKLGGVVANPQLGKVKEGIKLCKAENIDFILAVGGGSVIDSAKAIAYGVKYNGDVWDFYSRKAQAKDALPVGAILTMAAAGSEMSDASVITNDDGLLKRGYSSAYGHCKFALMNPKLTFTVSAYQTASGCVDILMHTFERYFSVQGDSVLQDEIAQGLVKSVIVNAKIAVKDPENYNARSEIMWASTLSHNGTTGDRFLGDWACHQLEHELSALYGVAHGAGLAAVWPTWAKYVMDTDFKRFAKLGRGVFGIDEPSDELAATMCVEKFREFFRQINMPVCVADMGISKADYNPQLLAEKCSFFGTRSIGAFKKLSQTDMCNIYEKAYFGV